MTALFIYIAKINVALSLFCTLYLILFRHDTFFQLKRAYFMLSILFAVLFSSIAVSVPEWLISNFTPTNTNITISFGQLQYGLFTDTTVENSAIWKKTAILTLIIAYVTISIGMIMRISLQYITVVRIKQNSYTSYIRGITVYENRAIKSPFSFFKWIFINPHLHTEQELNEILIHEQTHSQQYHSIDTLLMELIFATSWWNPFVWIMRKEIGENLENIADKHVLNKGVSRKSYQYHLLKITNEQTAVQITNNFNVSQLKKRIIMMNQTETPKKRKLRFLFALPLMATIIFANSLLTACTNKQEQQNDQTEATATTTAETATPSNPPTVMEEKVTANEPTNTDKVFDTMDIQPKYPGGDKVLYRFLSNNIQYPVEAQEKNIQGSVVCQFVIEKNGSISDVKVVRSVHPLLDKEAVRVIKLMPKWTPGKQDGEVQRARYTLPISFKLQ